MKEELDRIPKEETKVFPDWVSEATYKTQLEMNSFIDGVNYVGDNDVSVGTPFVRDGQWVVRVATSDDFDPDEISRLYKQRTPLSDEQKEKYLKNSVCCPFCGSDEIESGPIEGDGETATSIVVCLECDQSWEDIFTLTAIEDIE